LANGMSVPPLPDLDALSLDELKKLVVQLLVEVTALREENQQLRAENARLRLWCRNQGVCKCRVNAGPSAFPVHNL
jgi:hypothetical protein